MKSSSTHFIQQTAKAALVTSVAIALILPAGLAGADSGTVTQSSTVAASSGLTSETTVAADPAKVKFSKEQAIAKLKELFPSLKKATVSSAELGSNNSYPAPVNQMIWNIQWSYQIGTSVYGFGSTVDAITGDLINASISYPLQDQGAYYPPKVSREQALVIAQAFIGKAASSVKSADLQQQEDSIYNYNNSSLFGPVQYSFSFSMLKNGILSTADNIIVTVDGDGNVTQFNKPANGLEYPSAESKITQAQAEKQITDSFDIGLYYIPVYKNGAKSSWILGWRPTEQGLYSIDAKTGKTLDPQGAVISSAAVTYVEVPQGTALFQPRSGGSELTAEQAAELVAKVGYIPTGRKLTSKMMNNDYQNPDRKVWRLMWDENQRAYGAGFPAQSYAEVDAATGQILQFQSDQFNGQEAGKTQTAPAGAKKLSSAEAKQKAIAIVNSLYPNASSSLKQIEYGGDWNVIADGAGYRYQFIPYYKGIPVSDATVNINLDLYGRLQYYTGNRNTSLEAVAEVPVPKLTKQEALAAYLEQYKVKLNYKQIGGHSTYNIYVEPQVKLVYELTPADVKRNFEVLDAVTGKWTAIYENLAQQGAGVAEANDIKGHAAEQPLSELLKYGVLVPDKDGKLNPDQEITVGEWLSILAKAYTPYYASSSAGSGVEPQAVAGVSPDNPDYAAVSFAAVQGWIGKDAAVKTESKLTREQLAVLLTSFVKYSKISAFLAKDAAIEQFSDASAIGNKGAVALSVKLGLLQGENGKFNPQQTLTKGQAAAVIMKLVELQGKIDQSIGRDNRY